MKIAFNAPTKNLFWLTIVLAIVAAILFTIGGFFLDVLVIIAFGTLAVAFIILVLGVLFEKM